MKFIARIRRNCACNILLDIPLTFHTWLHQRKRNNTKHLLSFACPSRRLNDRVEFIERWKSDAAQARIPLPNSTSARFCLEQTHRKHPTAWLDDAPCFAQRFAHRTKLVQRAAADQRIDRRISKGQALSWRARARYSLRHRAVHTRVPLSTFLPPYRSQKW